MEINFLGLIAAFVSFISIWFGHVGVRKIEAISPKILPPIVVFIMLGFSLEFLSFNESSQQLRVIFGIIGITLLWDGFEIFRQERRVRKGHAPANPKNPRHAAFLAEENSCATVEDLLDREPSDGQNGS